MDERAGTGAMSDMPVEVIGRAERREMLWRRAGFVGAVLFALVLALAAAGVALVDPAAVGLGGYLLLGGLVAVGLISLFAATGGPAVKGGWQAIAAGALEVLRDPCFVTDKRGAVLVANAAYRKLSDSDPAGRVVPLDRLMAGIDGAADRLFRLSQAARMGAAGDDEIRLIPPGGQLERIFHVEVTPLAGPDGLAAGDEVLWRLHDLTAMREREHIAGRELQRFRSYLDEAPVGFFSARANGEIDYLNDRLAEWLGLDPRQAMERGLTVGDLIAGDASGLTPVPNGASNAAPRTVDLDLKGPDGKAVPVRMVQAYSFDSRGGMAGMRALVLARGGEEQGEETALEAEMRFARFFNNAPIGIAMVDGQGRIDKANGAFVSFIGEGVPEGSKLVELVVQEDRGAVAACLEETLSGKISRPPFDIRLEGPMDKVAQLYASRIDPGDQQASVIVYLIDATEQKSLEMQFAQSQKMQAVGQLAGGVAHDFNNLLTAIIGFCDLLLSRHPAGDPSFADIMQVKQNANRAANLVRQLLAFSRRQTLRPKVLSLMDAIAELQNLLGRLLGEKVTLKIIHGRDLGLVKVDQNQLEQVIMNLAVNARDAMPGGGTLTIRTANISEADARALDHTLMPAAEYVLIEVADTGMGIAKENLGKIFEPFFTTKDVSKGTGLGLSTVYGIIKQTGGYIFPFSAVGKGTTFRIYLPRYFPDDKEANAPREAAPPPEAADLTGKGTILLVEDEDAVRTFAVRALETRGYEVLQAECGEAALELVKGYDGIIDLVVSDVVMPNMDGPTMVKELRRMRPDAKIVFISGYAEDAFRKSLDQPEDFRFLPKPFSLKQLAAIVKEEMGGS